MAQATEVLPFPSQKLTFKAEKIDCRAVINKYDGNRAYIAMALQILTKTPSKLKKSILNVRNHGHESGLAPDTMEKLAADFEAIADDCAALCELMRASSARITATRLGLT